MELEVEGRRPVGWLKQTWSTVAEEDLTDILFITG